MTDLAVTVGKRRAGRLPLGVSLRSLRIAAAVVMVTKVGHRNTLLMLAIGSNPRPSRLEGHNGQQKNEQELSHAAEYTQKNQRLKPWYGDNGKSSRRLRYPLTAGCVRCSTAAALVTVRTAATAMKARRRWCWMFIANDRGGLEMTAFILATAAGKSPA